MRWPWQARRSAPPSAPLLVFSLRPEGLAWLLAHPTGPRPQVRQAGLLQGPATDLARGWTERLGRDDAPQARGLLPLGDHLFLQIEAPPVPAEELKAAARWHIRELVDGHIDEFTLDVLQVGDPALRQALPMLFVVAAANEKVAAHAGLARSAGWPMDVVDVAELAQRNLHTAAARQADLADRATACLMRHGEQCLLTVCVGPELYDARRLAWTPGLGDPTDEAGLRLVVELQRSFDVWERSWPDRPLAQLWVEVQDETAQLAPQLEFQLGMRALPLPLDAALDPGPVAEAPAPERRALLPLLGALLRDLPDTD